VTHDEFNAFCASLVATRHVVQWGGSQVWKVADKIFAIGGRSRDGIESYSFKVSELSFDILKDQPGLRPATYLASRGMKWIQHHASPGLTDPDLRAYLARSHLIVAAGLSRKRRILLGLEP